MKHCEQNLCPSASSILEIIEIFENNPLLGLLVPPLPFFGNFISSLYNPLGRNLNSLCLLNKKVFDGKLFSGSKIDVLAAPLGGMFWARTEALTALFSFPFSFEDFPKEPIKKTDGTILHALERCYPLVVRRAGFYTARVINISLVPILYNNFIYFYLTLPITTRIIFSTKNMVKLKLSRYPFLYEAVRNLFRKFVSY